MLSIGSVLKVDFVSTMPLIANHDQHYGHGVEFTLFFERFHQHLSLSNAKMRR